MIVKFENKFKVELKTPGNSFKLCTYRLGCRSQADNESTTDSLTHYFQFESLWDPDTRILNMALDLSFLRKDSIEDIDRRPDLEIAENCNHINVYYSDLNDNILGLAFELTDSDSNVPDNLNLCSFDAEVADPAHWRNMNYINLRFPKDTKANIETLEINENTDFLEQLTSTEGINTFLVEGNKENDTILTKDSFAKHVRNAISKNNNSPMYLDYCGEKVFDIGIYKYYKKIVITCIGPTNVDTLEDGTVTCSVNNRSSVAIKGYCLFDKYKVINNEYTLVGVDQREDLEKTTLIRLINGVETSERNGIYIDPVNKQIKIDDVEGINSEIDIAAKLTFVDKLGTDEDQEITLISNVVRINLFFSWYIEYFTSYTELDEEGSSHPVILFDTEKGNKGWIESNYPGTVPPGTILIYSSKIINTETGINIVAHNPEKQGIFDEYFTIEILDQGFDESANKYIYSVEISTNKENTSDVWYPIDPSIEESALVLMDINIGNSIQEGELSAQFYCVQRVVSPLTLGKANVTIKEENNSRIYTWVEKNIERVDFEGGLGITFLDGLFVCNPKIGYECWEASLDDDALSNMILYSVKNNIETYGGNPKEDNEIFFYTRINSKQTDKYLGTVTFRRINNKTKSYNKNYWQDRIYGDELNSITIPLWRQALMSDSLWRINSDTPYSYLDPEEGISRRLYLFKNSEYQSFTIESTQSLGILNVTLLNYTEEGETSAGEEGLPSKFNSFFEFGEGVPDSQYGNISINYSEDNKVATVRLKSKSQKIYDWAPKCSNGKPIRIKISYSSQDENDPLNGRCEIFYAVVRPSFIGAEMTFRDTSDSEYPILEEYTFPEIGGNLPTFVVGPVNSYTNSYPEGDIGVFNYWIVLKKDPEITVKFQGKPEEGSVTYACSLITNPNKTTWATSGFLTEISTKSIASTSLARNLDDLILRRAGNSYDNIVDYYIDWINQICDHNIARLKLTLGGAAESKTVKVSYHEGGLNNNIIDLHNDSYLPLREIGIYRLNIKCDHPFRVTLIDNEDERSIVGFYDSVNDTIKKSTMLDINTFDNIVGTEVDLLFLGYEDDGFSRENSTLYLNTRIQVTNLYDNTSVSFGTERTYYEVVAVEDNNYEWRETLFSQITPTNPRDFFIFIPSETNDINLEYTSAIETYRIVSQFNGITWTKTVTNKPKFSKDLYYTNINYSVSQNSDKVIPRHGYLRHNLGISIGIISNNGTSYPIKCFGGVNLTYQGDYLGENKTYYLFKLLKVPTALISTFSIDNTIPGALVLPYAGTAEAARVEVTLPINGNYRLFFLTSGSEVPIEVNKSGNTSISVLENKTITFVGNGNNTFQVSMGNGVNARSNYIFLGTIYATSYVDKNNFALDKDGQPLGYTQEEVDRITGTGISNTIPVQWGTSNGTGDYVTGNFSLISRNGETRVYTIHSSETDIDPDLVLIDNKFLSGFRYLPNLFEGYSASWKRLIDQEFAIDGNIHNIRKYSNSEYIELLSNNNYDLSKNSITFKYLSLLRNSTSGGSIDRSVIFRDTDLTIPVVQESWEKGILGRRVDSSHNAYTYDSPMGIGTVVSKKRLFLGSQNKNVDIIATATENHVYLELYQVQIPTITSDSTYDVLEENENCVILKSLATDGDERLTIDYDTELEVVKTVEEFIEDSSNRKIYLDIKVPENNSFYDYQTGENEHTTITDKTDGPYEIRVTDGGYNSINFNIYVNPRGGLMIGAYQDIESASNGADSIGVSCDNVISTVLLSATGDLFGVIADVSDDPNNPDYRLFYQDYFYIATNATDDMIRNGFSVKVYRAIDEESNPIENYGPFSNTLIYYTGSVTSNDKEIYYYDPNSSNRRSKPYVIMPNRNVNIDFYSNLEYEYVGEDPNTLVKVFKVKVFNVGVSRIWSTFKDDIYSTIEVPETDEDGNVTTRKIGDNEYTNTVVIDGKTVNKRQKVLTGIAGTIIEIQKRGSNTNYPITNGTYGISLSLSVGKGRKTKEVNLTGYHGHSNILLSSPRISYLSVKAFADTMSAPGIYNLLPTPIVNKYIRFEKGLNESGATVEEQEEYDNFYREEFETELSANADVYQETDSSGVIRYCVDINNTVTINYTASDTFKNKIFSKYGFLCGFIIRRASRTEYFYYDGYSPSATVPPKYNLYSAQPNILPTRRGSKSGVIRERVHYFQGNAKSGLVLTLLNSSGTPGDTYKPVTVDITAQEITTIHNPVTVTYDEGEVSISKRVYKDYLENLTLRRRTRSDNPTIAPLVKSFGSYDQGIVFNSEFLSAANPDRQDIDRYTSAIFNDNESESNIEYGTIYLRDIFEESSNTNRIYTEQCRPGIFLDIPKSKFTMVSDNIYEYVTDEIYLSDYVSYYKSNDDNGGVMYTPKSPIRIKIRIKL